MTNEQLVALLNELIVRDVDTAEAYETALRQVTNAGLKRTLEDFCRDHHRHVEVLSEVVAQLGGVRAARGDIRRLVNKGKVLVSNVGGEAGIMAAMRASEAEIHARYEEVSMNAALPVELRRLIHDHLGDERRHAGWVDARLAAKRPSTVPPPLHSC